MKHTRKHRKKMLIKRELAKPQRGTFVVTEEKCYEWWKHVNDAVFDGKLNPPKEFILRNFYKNTWGWCQPAGHPKRPYREVRIGISTGLSTKQEFLQTLIHEMVHQWEWEYYGEWDDSVQHGRNFYSWREPIRKMLGVTIAAHN